MIGFDVVYFDQFMSGISQCRHKSEELLDSEITASTVSITRRKCVFLLIIVFAKEIIKRFIHSFIHNMLK